MRLHLFAGLRVRNFQAARAWYERLLGEPTFFPHAAEAVWTLAEDRSVYVVEHADGAGNCVVTIFVDDLDARVAAIAARGIEPDGREMYSNGVRKVLYRDPDGNEVGFGGAPLEAGSCRPSPTRKPRHATCGPLEPFNRLKTADALLATASPCRGCCLVSGEHHTSLCGRALDEVERRPRAAVAE